MRVSRLFAATALCVLGIAPLRAQTFNVSYTGGEPSGGLRLFRDAIPSSAGTLKPFPGTLGNVTTFFDVFALTIPTGSSILVTETAGSSDIFVSLYEGGLNPTDLSEGYRGDAGISDNGAQFSFTNTGPGTSFFIVVNNTAPQTNVSVQTITGQVVVAAAPEPGTITLAAVGVGALILARRRRR